MTNITFHLGDSTFVVEKEVLSRFLGVFQTNGTLKSATSYNIKSNVQKQVFQMFLQAIKTNMLPKVTNEIIDQMVQLSEEFKYNDLRLYLIQNKQRLSNMSTRKANIRRAYTLVETDKHLDIFETNFTKTKESKSSQKKTKNHESKENSKSSQNKNIELSKDNDYSSSYSYYSDSYSNESEDPESFFSDDVEVDQDSDVEFDLSSDDELEKNVKESSNENVTESKPFDVQQSNKKQLNSIQRMAIELEKALFGSSSSGTEITTEEFEKEKHIDDKNMAFQSKINHLDYVLFGNKKEQAVDRVFNPTYGNYTNKETDEYTMEYIGAKRKPRHTFRHLPSIIYQDN